MNSPATRERARGGRRRVIRAPSRDRIRHRENTRTRARLRRRIWRRGTQGSTSLLRDIAIAAPQGILPALAQALVEENNDLPASPTNARRPQAPLATEPRPG